MSGKDQEKSDTTAPRKARFLRPSTKDPLVVLGLVIIVIGVALTVYGFIPIIQASYKQTSSGPVPLTDSANNFITDPETYYQTHYNGTATINRVVCSPSVNGFYCYGYTFEGMVVTYSAPAKEYGAGIVFVGVLALYGGSKLEPAEPKKKHLRPITIRIDEDICISNGVCVGLAPTVFQLKKQETPTIFAPLAYVLDPRGADNDTIIEAAQMCPTGAIIIEDAETGERIHPPLPQG